MRTQEKTQPAAMPLAGKLAKVAALAMLAGIGMTVLSMVLAGIFGEYPPVLEAIVGRAGLFLTCALAPLLGAWAAVSALKNWQALTAAAAARARGRILTLPRRFLLAALLFAAATSLAVVLALVLEGGLAAAVPDWMLVWHVTVALLAMLLGVIAFRLATKSTERVWTRVAAACVVLLALASAGAGFREINLVTYLTQRAQYANRRESFAGDSSALKDTVIVPTLDTPCPANKNIIWCCSFQLAWNRLKEDVVGEPIRVVGGEEIAARLNAAPQTAADLEPASFYAAAGWTHMGIAKEIEEEMTARFPLHRVPDLNDVGGVVAYSFLKANVPFVHPFRQYESGFLFTDSRGNQTRIEGFGLWEAYQPPYENVREQVEILYVGHSDPNDPTSEITECAVDLCKHSEPYQVVVALTELKGSLTETLDRINRRVESFRRSESYEERSPFDSLDLLLVPDMFWEIDHRFAELVDKALSTADEMVPIGEARQTIRFRLDRSGAVLESEAVLAELVIPTELVFSRPFLVYMKKRGREHPFFAMWVDNAELLVRR